MPFYHTLGSIPRKRHIVFRRPDGGLYAEELMGHEGFVGTSSLLYHVHPPTTVKSVRRVRNEVWEIDDATSLRHRHFRTARLPHGGSPTLDRTPLLFNQDIAMSYVAPEEQDAHFWRNSQADEVIYVVEGNGVLESVYGDLAFRPGDYVVIHRNITHRWRLDLGSGPVKFVVFESRGHIRYPSRYRNDAGQLLEGAPYSERDIRRPHRAADPRRARRFPHLRQAVRRHQRAGARPPSVRRGRLGRLFLSRGPSTSTISSRSSAGFTSHPRCTRPSRATAS